LGQMKALKCRGRVLIGVALSSGFAGTVAPRWTWACRVQSY
jgi:hypothetical protein